MAAGGGIKINNISVRGGADGKTPTFSIDTDTGELTYTYAGDTEKYRAGKVVGEKGDKGDKGDAGTKGADGVTPNITAAATVDNNTGTPTVTITKSGTDAAPNFTFSFKNLKGEKGDKGDAGSTGASGLALKQTTGTSTTNAMSQKAVTDELNKIAVEKVDNFRASSFTAKANTYYLYTGATDESYIQGKIYFYDGYSFSELGCKYIEIERDNTGYKFTNSEDFDEILNSVNPKEYVLRETITSNGKPYYSYFNVLSTAYNGKIFAMGGTTGNYVIVFDRSEDNSTGYAKLFELGTDIDTTNFATKDDIKKYYQHNIVCKIIGETDTLKFSFISSYAYKHANRTLAASYKRFENGIAFYEGISDYIVLIKSTTYNSDTNYITFTVVPTDNYEEFDFEATVKSENVIEL